MSLPLVSICIPTHQRCRYLHSLLDSLAGQLEAFPHAYEVVIADNASLDDTTQVVQAFSERLPIRYLRHEHNIGGYPNWHS
jgi:glycosyltransferase involved in cell wall biosynthesis